MTADLSKEALDALQDAARRADGSEVLPRVMLGRFRADDLIKRMGEVITTLCTENDKWFEACGANHASAMKEAQRADQAEARATAAEAQLAAAMEGAVRVKPLLWQEHLVSNGKRQIAYAVTPLATYRISQKFFPETFFSVEVNDGGFLSADTLEAAKAAAQADYERRILAALEPNPAAQAERDALEAATLGRADKAVREALEAEEDNGNCCGAAISAAQRAIRALATQPQTHALAARDRAKVVEGMRIAAGIAFDRRGTQSGDTWDAGWYQACATVRHEILDAAEREAGE